MKGSIVLGAKELSRDKISTSYCIILLSVLICIIQIVSMVIRTTMLQQRQANSRILLMGALLLTLWLGMILFLLVINKLIVYKNKKNYVIYHTLGMKINEIRKIIISKSMILSFFSTLCADILCVGLYIMTKSVPAFRQVGFWNEKQFIINQLFSVGLIIIFGGFLGTEKLKLDSADIRLKKVYEGSGWTLRLGDKSSGKWKYPFCLGIKRMQQDCYNLFTVFVPIVVWILMFIRLSYSIEQEWVIGDERSDWGCNYVVSMKDAKITMSDTFLNEIKQIKGVTVYEQWESNVVNNDGEYKYYYDIKLPKALVTEAGKKQFALCNPIENDKDVENYHVLTSAFGYDDKGLEKLNEFLIEGKIDEKVMKEENVILLPRYISWSENVDLSYCDLEVGDKVSVSITLESPWVSLDNIGEVEFIVGGFLSQLPLPNTTVVSNGYGIIMHIDRLRELKLGDVGIKYISVFGGVDSRNTIEDLCKRYDGKIVEYADDFTKKRDTSTIIFYAFFGIICVILFFMYFHIVFSKIVERKKEYLLLKILGFDMKQQMLAFTSEIFLPIISGIILGNGIGILWLFNVIGKESGNIYPIRYLLPWRNIIFMNVFGIAAVFAALWRSYKYMKKEI